MVKSFFTDINCNTTYMDELYFLIHITGKLPYSPTFVIINDLIQVIQAKDVTAINCLNSMSDYLSYLPSLSSMVTLALDGFNMAAGSVDVRVTMIVSESSTIISSCMGIVTV